MKTFDIYTNAIGTINVIYGPKVEIRDTFTVFNGLALDEFGDIEKVELVSGGIAFIVSEDGFDSEGDLRFSLIHEIISYIITINEDKPIPISYKDEEDIYHALAYYIHI